MGRALVDIGNLVGESGQDTILAEFVQEDPIHVYFAAPEGEALPKSGGDPSGPSANASPTPIPVRIVLGDGTRYPHEGVVDYVEPTVDATLGTLAVRARVPNPEGALRPGQFVRVVAGFPDVPTAVLDPAARRARRAGGSYVLLVGKDDTVERRPIRPGRMVDGRQEVLEGLLGGERVIVDGVQGVRPGDVVRAEPIAADGERSAKPPAAKPGEPPAERVKTG